MRVKINEAPHNPISYERVDRYTYNEFMEQLQKEGAVTDTIMIRLWDFQGYPDIDYTLINSVVDISNHGTHGIFISNYDVIGGSKEDILLRITLKKSPA